MSKRFEATKTLTIKANVEDTLGLACPVKELEWIPGWQYEMVFSESGVNEVGCIFNDKMSGMFLFGEDLNTYWHTLKLGENVFQAHLSYGGRAAGIFTSAVNDNGDGTVDATWHLVFTSYEETGEDFTEKIQAAIDFLSACGKHYLETGEMAS